MKKAGCILSAICLAVVLAGLTAVMGDGLEVKAAVTRNYSVGNITQAAGDADVTSADADALVAHLTGADTLSGDALVAADTNGDSTDNENVVVDVKDLVRYRRYLTEASTSLSGAGTSTNPYLVNTLSDLLCLQRMVNDKEFNSSGNAQFENKSIKLTADIEVNVVDLANESTGALSVKSTDQLIKEWTPIGTGGQFAGIFSGYDTVNSSDAVKEISGIYISATDAVQGLFGNVYTYGSVNNLKLTNSYIQTTFNGNAHVGSFVGQCAATIAASKTFKNLYSDAVIVCDNGARVGGIIGNLATNADTSIENCMYAGHLTAKTHCAGIVGRSALGSATATNSSKVTNIVNCVNYGTVTAKNNGGYIGEIVGVQDRTKTNTYIQTKKLSLNGCLGAGSINAAANTTRVGALIGQRYIDEATNLAEDTTKLLNSSAVGEYKIGTTVSDLNIVGGYDSTAENFDVTSSDVFDGTLLSGIDYYRIMNLDFASDAPTWSVVEDGCPILTVWSEYADNSIISDVTSYGKADLSWFTADGGASEDTPYVIADAADMRGIELIERLEATDFTGKFFKLTADIKDLSSESDLWIPLGNTNAFNGTFNGDGHTIDNMYVVANDRYSGLFGNAGDDSALRNVRLGGNCIITVDGTNCGGNLVYAGSLAGQSSGTIEYIYSEAIVDVTKGKEVGGIVGRYAGATTKMIKNCWFNGEATSTMQYVGGIVGRIQNGVKTIQDCLNTGLVQGNAGTTVCVGGICGGAEATTTTATFTRCVNNGEVKNTGAGTGSLGSVLGAANDKVTLTPDAGLYTITGCVATAKGTAITSEPYATTTVVASAAFVTTLGSDVWSYNAETDEMNLTLPSCSCSTTE